MTTWATQRLDALTNPNTPLPPVIQTLRLGGLYSWSPGLVTKTWSRSTELLNVHRRAILTPFGADRTKHDARGLCQSNEVNVGWRR